MLKYICILFSIFLISLTNHSDRVLEYVIEADSEVYIVGSNNLSYFTCYCNCKEELSYEVYSARMERNETGFVFDGAHLDLRTKNLDCGNKRMNMDMYQTLKADQFQYIKIELEEVLLKGSNLHNSTEQWIPYNALVNVTIAGVNQSKLLKGNAKSLGEGKYRFESTARLELSDFNIDPPVALMGLIKVKNEIDIYLNIIVQKKS